MKLSHLQATQRIKRVLEGDLYLKHSGHSFKRCFVDKQRQFNREDILSVIHTGTVRSVYKGLNRRLGRMVPTYIVHGLDQYRNWTMLVLSDEGDGFLLITMGPATNRELFGNQVAF